VNEEDEESAANAHVQSVMPKAGARMSFTAPQNLLAENEKEGEHVDPMEAHRASRVSDREDEYKARRRQRIISPERHDPFAAGDQVTAYSRQSASMKSYFAPELRRNPIFLATVNKMF